MATIQITNENQIIDERENLLWDCVIEFVDNELREYVYEDMQSNHGYLTLQPDEIMDEVIEYVEDLMGESLDSRDKSIVRTHFYNEFAQNIDRVSDDIYDAYKEYEADRYSEPDWDAMRDFEEGF